MKGTEKQVKWAMDIQSKAVGEMTALSNDLAAAGKDEAAAAAKRAAEAISIQDDARWLINNQDDLGVVANHPSQCRAALSWKSYVFNKIRNHVAFHGAYGGLKLRTEGQVIYKALHDLEEAERLGGE